RESQAIYKWVFLGIGKIKKQEGKLGNTPNFSLLFSLRNPISSRVATRQSPVVIYIVFQR
ncbi:MAG TPA: hypothetical protein PLN63_07800, partial [Paludibacteraceae bacterium]|nr:hypothetical protein [Paludibacteraceae bacterium]HQJ89916.1 hypothetical protein [Paludibacteraceae bacterium]